MPAGDTPDGPSLAETGGEFGLIRRIRDRLPEGSAPLVLGPGDDAALLAPPSGTHVVLTVDSLVENVHWKRSWMEPERLARRLLVQGLSDLAAMGARPLCALVALGLPAATPAAFADAFVDGLLDASRDFACPLAGGNLARHPDGVCATATLAGAVPAGAALLRSRARPGDAVWVTGFPGSAAAGVELLETGRVEAGDPLAARFLDPRPRIEEAAFLRDGASVACAIDLSDGVRRCAALLAEESGVRIVLDAARFPADAALEAAASKAGRDVVSLALDGGEDFELLFTARPGAVERVRARFEKRFGVAPARIGEVREGEGLVVEGDPGAAAFEHFAGRPG